MRLGWPAAKSEVDDEKKLKNLEAAAKAPRPRKQNTTRGGKAN